MYTEKHSRMLIHNMYGLVNKVNVIPCAGNSRVRGVDFEEELLVKLNESNENRDLGIRA